MSYSSNQITKPVSVYDVQRALGSSSPDVGTLSKHENIKTWAKYRPIEYRPGGVNFLNVLTLANRAAANRR